MSYSGNDEYVIRFTIDPALRDRFTEACAKMGTSKAKLLREFVSTWIEEVEHQPPEEDEACSTSTT